ncbi:MAG: hypothetical protein ACRD63_06400 [Pyrinomonadaceae bacterium]
MSRSSVADQPALFSGIRMLRGSELVESEEETLVLFALGDFQSRGKQLAERELPLDRLRGAFRRAAERYQTEEMTDQRMIAILRRLGAETTKLPSYVAKHPYRVRVNNALADRASVFYRREIREHTLENVINQET